jgi:hypothetical protein
MYYFFTKTFNEVHLHKVEYHKCKECGFVTSKTHRELDEDKWKEINNHFHNLHSDGSSQYNSSKRWFNQALMLYLLSKHNIIPNKDWLDYAEDARLVEKKVKRFNLEIGWDYLKFKIGFMDYWK